MGKPKSVRGTSNKVAARRFSWANARLVLAGDTWKDAPTIGMASIFEVAHRLRPTLWYTLWTTRLTFTFALRRAATKKNTILEALDREIAGAEVGCAKQRNHCDGVAPVASRYGRSSNEENTAGIRKRRLTQEQKYVSFALALPPPYSHCHLQPASTVARRARSGHPSALPFSSVCSVPEHTEDSASTSGRKALSFLSVHPDFGTSFVRSISMDTWQEEQLRRMKVHPLHLGRCRFSPSVSS